MAAPRPKRPHPFPTLPGLVALSACLAAVSCGPADDQVPPGSASQVYQGATLIFGDGRSPVQGGVLVVSEGRIVAAGAQQDVPVPDGAETIDVSGKTIMPAVVNAHVHLPPQREARIQSLRHMAYWGTGLAVSLGHDSGTDAFTVRDAPTPGAARSLTAGRGITTPEPGRSEVPHWVTTPDEASSAVDELARQGVDIIKIWVDDRGGQYEKLGPELYGAVIETAHGHGLPVTAHIFTLEDAKGLLRSGIDAFAHGIRDRDVDDELVDLWMERPDVVLVPNLPGPGVAEDLSWLSETVPDEAVAEMQAGSVDRPEAREAFGIQARNLVRLSEAGVPIAFGTDGGSPWAIHQEMADMVRAGLSPAQVIQAATGTSAAFMGVEDAGTLDPGKRADFVVLDANPLEDIANTKRIDSVVLAGEALDREDLAAQLKAGG
ncbi:MAG: amidohydrolase family protein [Gemmatimonadetes bacterium]|nr:amidohydrolase family protein [Gemmatimonadota bacterium]